MLSCLILCLASAAAIGSDGGTSDVQAPLDIHRFKVIQRDSGPVNYYGVVEQPEGAFVHARYRPGLESVTLGLEIPDALRRRVKRIRWQWRVQALPIQGNDCRGGKTDSAAGVFVTFKRGLKYYLLKYIWSTEAPKGMVCDVRRNPFVARDTIVLESGGPLNTWVSEEIDPRTEFLRHFKRGGSVSDVPNLVGIGLFTDGDQTQSLAEADYGNFVLTTD